MVALEATLLAIDLHKRLSSLQRLIAVEIIGFDARKHMKNVFEVGKEQNQTTKRTEEVTQLS